MTVAAKITDQPGFADPCLNCTVRRAGICAAIEPADLAHLRRHVIRRTVRAGSELHAEGTANTSYANILSGVVKLTRVFRDGREQIVGLQFSNDFLGQPFADERGVTAEAATDVEICSIPKGELDRLAHDRPAVSRRMHRQAAADLEEAREWMMTLARKDAREKVANLIYKIARRLGGDARPSIDFELPLSRADIADHLGLTVETVSRQFTKLRSDGIIAITNKTGIRIPDMPRLAHEAGI